MHPLCHISSWRMFLKVRCLTSMISSSNLPYIDAYACALVSPLPRQCAVHDLQGIRTGATTLQTVL